MKLVQCVLQSDKTKIITYLESEKHIVIGNLVTLKDSETPDRLWKVLSKGIPREFKDIKGGKTSKKFYRHDFIKKGDGYVSCK